MNSKKCLCSVLCLGLGLVTVWSAMRANAGCALVECDQISLHAAGPGSLWEYEMSTAIVLHSATAWGGTPVTAGMGQPERSDSLGLAGTVET